MGLWAKIELSRFGSPANRHTCEYTPPINFQRAPDSTRLTSAAPQPPGFHAASGDVDRSAHGDATSR